VLVHGLGLDRHMWREHRAALQSDYRVLTYDLFGHGDSAAPPAEPSLALWCAQLRALLDALGIGVGALVGFSLGGMIVRRFAIDHPGRVCALAIFNSPHERSPAAQRQAEEGAARTVQDGIATTLDSILARWFTAEFRAAHPGFIEQTRRRLLANDLEIYAQCRRVLPAPPALAARPPRALREVRPARAHASHVCGRRRQGSRAGVYRRRGVGRRRAPGHGP